MIDYSRLSTIIFDKGVRLSQSEYQRICEEIDSDKLTLNEYVIAYKKKDALIGNVFFTLDDGSRILLDESTLNTIDNLKIDKNRLVEFMRLNESNFKSVVEEIINGIE